MVAAAPTPSTRHAVIHLRPEGARIWVRWHVAGGTHEEAEALWMALRLDWRLTFRRHSEACYSRTRRMWSVPVRNRERLLDWIATWGMALGEEGETR